MTQDERWLEKYNEVKKFIETNHRNPSKHNPEERFQYYNWIKHNRQVLNSGEMKQDRVESLRNGGTDTVSDKYEQLDNKEVKECLGKLENHQELVYIT